MKKLIGIVLGISLIAASAFAADAAKEPIKIGDISSYTKVAKFAEPYRKGVDLAVKEINSSGGIDGRPLQIISRDSKMDAGEAIKLAEELFTRDRIVALMNWDASGVSLAVSNWANKNKMPFVVTGSEADNVLWEQGNDYVFRTCSNGYMWVSGTLQKAVEKYGDKIKNKKWAAISPNMEFGYSIYNSAKRIAAERGLNAEWVADQWPEYNKLDAGATISAIERSKPDVIFVMLVENDLAKLIREGNKRDLFKNRIIISPVAGFQEHFDMLKKETPVGWITTGFPADEIKEPSFVKFKQAYETAYNENPKTYSVYGYNAVYAIASALKKARSDEPAKIRDALETVSFPTPLGEQHFRKIDHQATTNFWIGVTGVENGKGKLMDWSMENAVNHMPSDAWILEQRKNGKKVE